MKHLYDQSNYLEAVLESTEHKDKLSCFLGKYDEWSKQTEKIQLTTKRDQLHFKNDKNTYEHKMSTQSQNTNTCANKE